MPTEFLVHATGVSALVLNVIALVRTCERSLRLQSSLAGAVWALNNLLLGAHTAAALSLVSAGRTASSAATLRCAAGPRLLAFGGFATLTATVSLLTWDGWPSLLVGVASLMSTFAMFYLRGRALRATMIVTSALWMHHAWIHGSWEQILANLATALAALYGAWRLDGPDSPARR